MEEILNSDNGHEPIKMKQKQSKLLKIKRGKRVQKDNAFINMILCQRWFRKHAKKKYGLTPMEIEIMVVIRKMNSDSISYCKVNEIKMMTGGKTNYNIWSLLAQLTDKGIIYNAGKGKKQMFYLDLTERGHEMVDKLQLAFSERMLYLHDQIELLKITTKRK